MAAARIRLRQGNDDLSLARLREVWANPVSLELDDAVWTQMEAASSLVDRIVAGGRPAYGINTGFGLLAQTRINDADLARLQSNLVLSHATGVGPALPVEVVRLIIVLKVLSLARGHSGARRPVVDALLILLKRNVMPVIPARGSVGASGDLAPLAHLSSVLLGHGEAWIGDKRVSAMDALRHCELEPLQLGPKEGLALLNGTQVSTALALAALFQAEQLLASAIMAGALSVDALKGSVAPFDPRIQALRRQPGQQAVAACYRHLLDGSEILHSHLDCGKVQDPYSLRCQPQVMGACLDLINNVARTLWLESNAVTDNPLLFPDSGQVLSGGNFHAQPVAFAADTLALAIAEIGALSERRTALLVDPKMSGLPAFLVEHSGLNSGFMIAQVTAAALVSENKSLAHPASVDSIPTSANQEDHVSMATFAARRLDEMAKNAAAVVAIELLAACQAVEFHRPHRSSEVLEAVVSRVREVVGNYDRDRYFAPDIEAAVALVVGGELASEAVRDVLPSSTT